MFQFPNNKKIASSRRQIHIKEVRDNILILPRNTYCMLLETSSVNFELKSEAEQDVLLESFQNFLNALPCKLQVLIRVRELDVETYLDQLKDNALKEKESIYKKQMINYREFIKTLISGNKILSRRFYIIVPYSQADTSDFSLIKEQLQVSTDIVSKGLEKMGMKAKPLDSLQILNLFYAFYSDSQAKVQPLTLETVKGLQNYGTNIL